MKRRAYLKHDEKVAIGKRGLTIWGYGRDGEFVCRLEISAAGIAVHTGTKGGKCLCNMNWERFARFLQE